MQPPPRRAKDDIDRTEFAGDIREAQKELRDSSVVMAEHYVRSRRGHKVTPTR